VSRVLVTGATGFIGGHLAKHLLERKETVVGILHDIKPFYTANLLGIDDKVIWAKGDITDGEFVKRVVAEYEVEKIYHVAALPIVRVGTKTTVPIFQANTMGTLNIFEAAKEHKLSGYDVHVLYMSTDKVYGHGGYKPYLEGSPLNGYGIYECSKACGDLIARAYFFNYDVKTVIVRGSNIYGPADLNSRIIPNTIRRCLRGLSPLVYKGITYVREFTHVDDACRAIVTLMEGIPKICAYGDLDPDNPESRHLITNKLAFNVGSGVSKDQQETISEILKHFPGMKPTYVDPQPYMAKEIPYQTLDSSKIREAYGWKPQVSFEKGIEGVVAWWRERRDIW